MSLPELQALEGRYAMATYARAPVEFVRGEGARLWDAEGREYLDFFAALGVMNAGHCHPSITAAIAGQAGVLAGTSNLYYAEPAMRLCERLVESSLGGRAFLCNSGAEANEAAIKLARKHAHRRGVERPEVVVLEGGFHGRTLGALAATPTLAREDLFGPLPQGFVGVPRDSASAMGEAVNESTAAILIEPIQGEAGVFETADEVLLAAREAGDSVGAALIFDEVQTGMGRTGSLWAYQQRAVSPDILTAAKALGGGLPVGACVVTPELGEVLEVGDHGSTFAGGAIAAAAAIAAIDVIDDLDLLERVVELGDRLRAGLGDLDGVGEVRGRGLMVGVSLDRGLDAGEVAARALGAGLVVNVPGTGMLRFLPPLIVEPQDVDRAVEIVGASLRG